LYGLPLVLEVCIPEIRIILLIAVLTLLVLGTRERHLESILQSTLRQIILIHNFPRTLIQVTLQITSTPDNENAGSKAVQATSVCANVRSLRGVDADTYPEFTNFACTPSNRRPGSTIRVNAPLHDLVLHISSSQL
jgi:hypothetical protein